MSTRHIFKSYMFHGIVFLLASILAGTQVYAGTFINDAGLPLPDTTGKQYEEVIVEQSLQVMVDSSQVFERLANLDNYAHFYPLFSELTVSPHHQSGRQGNLVDFTGISLQRFGPYYIEHTYYGMLSIDAMKRRIQLHMVDNDGVLIHLNMHIIDKDGHTQIDLKTVIKAVHADLAAVLVDELHAPTLRLEALKVLLENDILPASYFCRPSTNANRYCF